MRLKVFCRILFCISIFSNSLFSQVDFSGYVLEEITGAVISNVKIYSNSRGLLTITDDKGYFSFTSNNDCLLYTSPSPRDLRLSRMPSSA